MPNFLIALENAADPGSIRLPELASKSPEQVEQVHDQGDSVKLCERKHLRYNGGVLRNVPINLSRWGRVLAAAATITVTPMATADYAAVVDPSIVHQKWDGWGTSLCWWAHIVGGYPEPVRSDLCVKMFKDLGINVVRYNIGGGDDPTHTHMERRAAVPGYLSPDGKWDWTADAEQRWILQKAKALGANRFEAFSNSPPYWMTISGCAAGAKDGGNNLDPSRYDEFANYLAEVVKHFHDHWGIAFETLEPMNEPTGGWWKYGGRQEGCNVKMGPAQEGLILATKKALEARRSKTLVAASDENMNTWAVQAWNALTPAGKAAVSRINTHSYGGAAQKELHEAASRDGKPLWVSEYGDGDASGLKMARQIVRDLRWAQPSVWTYWQVIDQGRSGWGLFDMDMNGGKTDYVVNEKYFVFANFSRFIRPGSRFVDIADENSVAALSGRNLVVVTVNPTDAPETVDYDLSRFARAGESAAYRTSSTERLAALPPLPLADGRLRAELPARSVTTFVVRGGAAK